jgi:hypothetical protein
MFLKNVKVEVYETTANSYQAAGSGPPLLAQPPCFKTMGMAKFVVMPSIPSGSSTHETL